MVVLFVKSSRSNELRIIFPFAKIDWNFITSLRVFFASSIIRLSVEHLRANSTDSIVICLISWLLTRILRRYFNDPETERLTRFTIEIDDYLRVLTNGNEASRRRWTDNGRARSGYGRIGSASARDTIDERRRGCPCIWKLQTWFYMEHRNLDENSRKFWSVFIKKN